ncbi:cytochrome b561 domain-containing protein, partial [Salmonella sp. s51228]|uniref:cytochrome b561 domain-containing protein n=1 Tax=Salmonella sp. s51228 TaxID=3159652 RepID=UPI00397F7752
RRFVVMTNMYNQPHLAVIYGGDPQRGSIPTVVNPYIPQDEVVVINLLTSEKWIRVISMQDGKFGFPEWRHSHHMATGDGKMFIWGGRGLESGTYQSETWYLWGNYTENERYSCPMYYFTTEIAHGTMMFIAFGICFQVAVFIARYARVKDPLWFYLHISFNSVGIFFAMFGFILGFMIAVYLYLRMQSLVLLLWDW